MSFRVTGGSALHGKIALQGAKNAALPILFATLLCRAPVTLYHLPAIGDVSVALDILRELGARVERAGEAYVIDTRKALPPTASLRNAAKIRASSYLLGASLSAFGEGEICLPGGCDLGPRPLDMHEMAFLALGATVERDEGRVRVYGKKRKATAYRLPFPSVGATVNFIFAALGAQGESHLYGYAAEPHVLDLVGFLRQMGADVRAECDHLAIVGGALGGGMYTIISDAMEGGTYLLAAALCGGDVTVSSVLSGELDALLLPLRAMGFLTEQKEGSIRLVSEGASHYHGTHITAAPYPAFPTDLHPPFAVLLCATKEGGSITDTVWRDRFAYVSELSKMGVLATRVENKLFLHPSHLFGHEVCATDLRGGAALVLSALAAEGESLITKTSLICRGYADLPGKLRSLGAAITEE